MQWFNIEINANKIEARTDKAVLIKMNNNSDYKDYAFWHPAKLLRSKGGNYTFSFNEDFNFNLKKNGNGKYNKFQIVDETTIDYQEMLEQFGE